VPDYELTEADTRATHIDPALQVAGWESRNIRREYHVTAGRILPGGERGKSFKVDYLLIQNNLNVGIIEAKKESEHPTTGLEQVKAYGKLMGVDLLYTTNGVKLYEFSLSKGAGRYITHYPSPVELYERVAGSNQEEKKKLLEPQFQTTGEKIPRYYQETAINKALTCIAEGQERILLALATGTGKTFIAFQIVHKLFQSRWNRKGEQQRPKVLFLADRNILADQAINEFNFYEKDIVKINGDEIRRRGGRVPTNANMFFAIYQAIAERENIGGRYKDYPPDFFDLVIVDECHRGSAKEEGSWREILNYFKPAVQLGLTATPKRKDNVDTYDYFGEPVYEYSLSQGINDGFLSPYRVLRVQSSIDELVLTKNDTIIVGDPAKPIYKIPDFNRIIIIPERIEMVAKEILGWINTFDKTIIFCVDQEHALRMRDIINELKEVQDPDYCVRITSDEGAFGKQHLENFQNNDKTIPTIVTTSQLLTTGVDIRNVRNIVLAKTIGSMVEFKQIVGRGTRVFDGKDSFTIMDFTGATEHFYDPEWDGPAEEPQPPPAGGGKRPGPRRGRRGPRKVKVEVQLSKDRRVEVTNVEIRLLDETGKPLTAQQFTEKLQDILPELYQNEAELRQLWSHPDRREELLKALAAKGFDKEQLATLVGIFDAEDSDVYDVLAFLSFERQMITRDERVTEMGKQDVFFNAFEQKPARNFLHFILQRYRMDGISELRRDRLSELIRLGNLGTTRDASALFGGTKQLLGAFYDLQENLYQR